MNKNTRWSESTSCRLCDGSTSLLADLGDVSYATANNHKVLSALKFSDWCAPLSLRYCADCHFMQLGEVVNPQLLYQNFSYQSGFTSGLTDHFKTVAARIKSLMGEGGVLEVGSNYGEFLRSIQSEGMGCIGVEPSECLASHTQSLGFKTYCGYFSRDLLAYLDNESLRVNTIYIANTLANIHDLREFFDIARVVLPDQGLLVIDTQDLDAVIREGLVDTVYHEHLSYFSDISLIRLAHWYGFDALDISYNASKGGSFTLYLRKGSVNAMPLTLSPSVPVSNLSSAINQLEITVARFKQQHGRFACFGSSVGCSALFNWLDLSDNSSLVLDDNPRADVLLHKSGTTPILLASDVLRNYRDPVLMLAHRYIDFVVKRHGGTINFFNPWKA